MGRAGVVNEQELRKKQVNDRLVARHLEHFSKGCTAGLV